MPTGASLLFPAPGLDTKGGAELLALLEQTMRMVDVATALVASDRHVDVSGLQNDVGLLCAKALDLPASEAGFVKLGLQRLAARLDTLDACLRETAA
ncbi:MAG: hypothetical protein RQ966_16765 [Acetobacteraceae bacterium]|nr:hypothetical protein [Acetobacteraceae bacterium]